VEVCYLKIRECFVYKLPPRANAKGHVAQEWGLEKPLWTGELKLLATDQNLWLRFSKNGEVFCESVKIPLHEVNVIHPLTYWVEPALDSSRYYVIRMQDPVSKKLISLGVGLRERSESFDFNAAINDRLSLERRQAEVPEDDDDDQPSAPADDGKRIGSLAPAADGARIKLNLNVGAGGKPRKRSTGQKPAGLGHILAPPPAAKQDDDDWGDFSSA
jgi:hypothetical protein